MEIQHHNPIEHLPHLQHANDLIDIDIPPNKLSSNTRIGVGVKLRSIGTPPTSKIFDNDINFGDESRLNSRGRHHPEQDNFLAMNDISTYQQPQPPLAGKPSKSLQAKLSSKGHSSNNDAKNDDAFHRNNFLLEPIEHASVKKIGNDSKFEKQGSYSEKSVVPRRSNSFREVVNDSSIKRTTNHSKQPRVEEEGTVLRGKLLDVQQSHQRQRKERPLYVRMISRAQRKRQDEDRKKVEEYEAHKKIKSKGVPLRSDIREHMSRYDDQKSGNAGPKYSNVKDKDLAARPPKIFSSKLQRPQQQQPPPQFLAPTNSLESDEGRKYSTVVSKRVQKVSSVRSVKTPDHEEEEDEDTGMDAAEEYEMDEEDETYAIRRQDDMITIPEFRTNSIVSFCADDWVNKLLEIDSIEKTKLTEMDYLLSY